MITIVDEYNLGGLVMNCHSILLPKMESSTIISIVISFTIQEPDTPDITAAVATAAPSHQPSPDISYHDNTLVTDLEVETVGSVSRRCYHPTRISPHHHYTSQADSVSSKHLNMSIYIHKVYLKCVFNLLS